MFLESDLDLWPTALTYYPDLAKVKVNLHINYQVHRSFQVWERTQRDRQMLPSTLSPFFAKLSGQYLNFLLVHFVGYERCSMKKVLLNWSPEVCISDNAGSNAISKSVSATTHVSCFFFFFCFFFITGSRRNTTQSLFHRCIILWQTIQQLKWNNTDELMEIYVICKCIMASRQKSYYYVSFQANHFVIYDLRFDCRYDVTAQPVCEGGKLSLVKVGAATHATFHTPNCQTVTAHGSLKPDCPTNGMYSLV